MQRTQRALGLSALSVVSLLSAGALCKETAQVRLDEAFELRIGQSATVASGELSLTFLSVPKDNRCPRGERCIIAGSAIVRLEAAAGGKTEQAEIDTAGGEAVEWDVSGFRVAVLDLQPYPTTDRPIAQGDYIARVVVRRS